MFLSFPLPRVTLSRVGIIFPRRFQKRALLKYNGQNQGQVFEARSAVSFGMCKNLHSHLRGQHQEHIRDPHAWPVALPSLGPGMGPKMGPKAQFPAGHHGRKQGLSFSDYFKSVHVHSTPRWRSLCAVQVQSSPEFLFLPLPALPPLIPFPSEEGLSPYFLSSPSTRSLFILWVPQIRETAGLKLWF